VKTKHYLTVAILAIVSVFQLNTIQLMSQTFTLSSGTFVNLGKINMKDNAGMFQTNATATFDNSSGTINFDGSSNSFTDETGSASGANALGVSSAKRLGGWMYYALSSTFAGTQTVQPRWYTSLGVTSTLTQQALGSGVYVSGTYTPQGNVANRTYSGTFFYDGSTSQTLTGGESYAALNLQNGSNVGPNPKFIAASSTVTASTFTIEPNQQSEFQVSGVFALNDGGSASISNGSGNVVIGKNGSGTFMLKDNSSATFDNAFTDVLSGGAIVTNGTTSGTMNLNASRSMTLETGSSFVLGNNRGFNISGTFANVSDKTNMNFGTTSNVNYIASAGNSAVYMLPTVSTNPYGNLFTSGSGTTSTFTPDGNIFIAGNLNSVAGDIDMGTSNTFVVNDVTKSITYGGLSEVRGNFRISNAVSAFVAATPYTLNNAGSKVTFATGGTPTSSFTMYAVGGTYGSSATSSLDIKRKVSLSYDGTSTSWTMQAGYRQSEAGISTTLGGNGTWDDSYTEAMLRFYESNSTTFEKMATASVYTRANSTPTAYGTVSLSNFTATPTDIDGIGDKNFLSGNDLIFRSGPSLFTTITPGRWSNGLTWDEGVEPAPIDQVLIRHTIWAGITRPIDNYATAEATPNKLASNITIDANQLNASLLLGGSGIAYGTNSDAVPGLTNNGNVTVNDLATGWTQLDQTTNTATTALTSNSTKYDGFYLLAGNTFEARRAFTLKGYLGVGLGSVINVGK
jgi:hypothetical protein